jgi:hypothetical protein
VISVAHPTYGFRTLKGKGSRLLRDLPDNDWINIQAREGTSGWKDGILFTRTYAYQNSGVNGPQHLYRWEATRLDGLDHIAEAHGKTSDEARLALYADLKRKGLMPREESGEE